MILSWQKNFHDLYLETRSQFDPHVIEWISKKEDYITASPQSHSFLKHDFQGIRRYKSGKLRILYVLSTESKQIWKEEPKTPGILFLYVDLRSDETYSEAVKAFKKHKIL